MYKNTIDEKFEELGSSRQGLSESERLDRRQKQGYNELINDDHRSFLSFYMEGLGSPILRVLFLGALFLSYVRRFEEALILFGIFVLYSMLSGMKNYRAQRARESFYKQNMPLCKVMQEGQKIELPMRELVPGDVVFLEEGDVIPADGRLFDGSELWVDESLLTGNKQLFCKDVSFTTSESVPLGERVNMLYASTLVCHGQAQMLVSATGMDTEIGKVAFMLYKDEERPSLLDAKLTRLGRTMGFLSLLIALSLGVFAFFSGKTIDEVLLMVVCLSLAASPKFFRFLVQNMMSFGSLRFSKHDVTLKKLDSIETLSSLSVLLWDEVPFLNEEAYRVRDLSSTSDEDELLMKKICLLEASEPAEGRDEILKALRRFVLEENPSLDRTLESYVFVEKFRPSGKNLSESLYRTQEKELHYAFGDLSDILGISHTYHSEGETILLEENIREGIQFTASQFEEEGKKVLAFAYKEGEETKDVPFTFLGLIALGEAGRSGAKEAIKALKNAGIRPVLLSNRSEELALELAKEIGLLIPGYKHINGTTMAQMSKEDFQSSVEDYSVYLCLSSDQRTQLVQAWEQTGAQVAITAQEIEDLPALDEASFSLAAHSQTKGVIKQTAKLLFPEQSPLMLPEAIADARMIFYNLRRKVRFELSVGWGLILSMLVIMAFFGDFAFSPLSLLWLGFVITVLPGLALEKELKERNIMFQAPPKLETGLISGRSFSLCLFEGLLLCAATAGSYYFLASTDGQMARTMSYVTFGMGILFEALSLRNSQFVLGRGFFSNKSYFAAFLVTVILLALPIYAPFISGIFGLSALPLHYLGLALGLSFAPTLITELRKVFMRE